jgi:hypothetical protein
LRRWCRPLNSRVVESGRLHAVRQQITALEVEESALRAFLLNHPGNRCGDEFLAVVRPMQRRYVDLRALAIEVGEATMAKYTSTRAVDVVRLSAIARPTRRKLASTASPWP